MSQEEGSMEVSVEQVKQMRDEGVDFLLLDVREPEEHQMVHIGGEKLIPMGELPRQIDTLRDEANGRPIVTYCHIGGRSLQAAHWLRQQGFSDVRSMAGGIEDWAVRIDPAKPRY